VDFLNHNHLSQYNIITLWFDRDKNQLKETIFSHNKQLEFANDWGGEAFVISPYKSVLN